MDAWPRFKRGCVSYTELSVEDVWWISVHVRLTSPGTCMAEASRYVSEAEAQRYTCRAEARRYTCRAEALRSDTAVGEIGTNCSRGIEQQPGGLEVVFRHCSTIRSTVKMCKMSPAAARTPRWTRARTIQNQPPIRWTQDDVRNETSSCP